MGRLLVACVIVNGCGFAIEPQSQPDAPATMPDGSMPDAAPPDAILVWTVIETLTIPTYAPSGAPAPVRSQMTLPAGVEHRLRVSGTFSATFGGTPGDAEYWDFVSQYDTASGIDVGLGIDDLTIDATKTRWGPYTATHVYEITYAGTGAQLSALLSDSQYDNNTGTLTLEILALR